MPVPDPSFGWREAAVAFTIIAVASFLLTWVVTDLAHVRRAPYVAILAVTMFGPAAGYLAWSGTPVADLATSGWGGGILAGVVAVALRGSPRASSAGSISPSRCVRCSTTLKERMERTAAAVAHDERRNDGADERFHV